MTEAVPIAGACSCSTVMNWGRLKLNAWFLPIARTYFVRTEPLVVSRHSQCITHQNKATGKGSGGREAHVHVDDRLVSAIDDRK